MVPGFNPDTTMFSTLPDPLGFGSPEMSFAESQAVSEFILELAYRTIYVLAVPTVQSSPGADQLRLTVPGSLPALAARSAIEEGGIVSAIGLAGVSSQGA